MIGATIVAIAAVVLVVGICLVLWDWVVRSNPDAPRGGPVVVVAVVGLLCGGVVSCTETMKDVAEIKAAQKTQRYPAPGGSGQHIEDLPP